MVPHVSATASTWDSHVGGSGLPQVHGHVAKFLPGVTLEEVLDALDRGRHEGGAWPSRVLTARSAENGHLNEVLGPESTHTRPLRRGWTLTSEKGVKDTESPLI